MGGAGRHGASRRGQETSAEHSPVMAGASGCMERVRDGTVALRRTTAGLLAAAGGGRCFKCRPGGRYFKHRPPPGPVSTVRWVMCGRDRPRISVILESHGVLDGWTSTQSSSGRHATAAHGAGNAVVTAVVTGVRRAWWRAGLRLGRRQGDGHRAVALRRRRRVTTASRRRSLWRPARGGCMAGGTQRLAPRAAECGGRGRQEEHEAILCN